jgi:hypothetical protein
MMPEPILYSRPLAIEDRAPLSAAMIAAAGMQVMLVELAKIRVALSLPSERIGLDRLQELRTVVIQESVVAQQEWLDSLWAQSGLLEALGPGPRLNVTVRNPDEVPQ